VKVGDLVEHRYISSGPDDTPSLGIVTGRACGAGVGLGARSDNLYYVFLISFGSGRKFFNDAGRPNPLRKRTWICHRDQLRVLNASR